MYYHLLNGLIALLFLIGMTATSANAQSITDYTFSSSSGTFTPLVGGNAPALNTGSNDDGAFYNIPIGFSFCYMGQTYTTFSASTNGWATLGQNATTALTNNLSTGTPRPVIAPLWDDLFLGTFSYQTSGVPGSQIFTAEWLNNNWNYLSAGAVVSFQVKLYEGTNVVEFVYRTEAGAINTPSASVGITASGTGAGNFLSASDLTTAATVSSTIETTTIATTPASGLTFDFTPPAPATPPTTMTFTGVTASGMTVNWVDNSTSESGFSVWRSIDNVTFTQVATVPSTSMATTGTPYSYNGTGLFSNTLYYWRVYATNANCATGFLSGQQSTNSGTMCGTYTIGPTGSYTSLTAAIAAVQTNGVLCPLVFELQAAYVSTVETFPIVVPFLGSGPSTNITVRPELGATNLSITSNSTVTIDMSGSSYFVFDGRPGGVGTIKELTIENTSTTGIAARFQQDAQSCGYTYCKMRGVNTSTVSGVIYFGNAATATGNSNNNINNCDIFDSGTQPANLVYALNSTAATFSTGNTFTNNTFHDWFLASGASTAMNISTGNSAWTISNNSFYQTATRTHTIGTTSYIINITPGSGTATGGFTVSGNYFGGSAANCGGTAYTENGAVSSRFIALQTNTGTGPANSIQGNTFKNFNYTTTNATTTANGIWCAINMIGTSASNNVGNVTPNTIGSTTTNGQIVTNSTTTSGGLLVGINSSASGTQLISGNQIGGLTANTGAATISSSIIGIQVTAGASSTITNNMIGSLATANNIINAASTSATGGQVTGILSTFPTNSSITGNTIMNLTNQYAGTSTVGQTRGIATTGGINTINNNTISTLLSSSNVTSATAPVLVGIAQSSTSVGQTVSNNTITNLANSSAAGTPSLDGIYYSGPASGSNKIFSNKITGIGAPLNTGTPVISGIYVNAGLSRYYNNMIVLGVDATGTSITQAHEYNGIYKVTTTNNSFFFNSVRIGGTGVNSGVPNTYAFRRTAASGTDSLYNNVFTNFRSNSAGGGTHYAIGVANTTTLFSNNNVFYGNGSGFVMGLVNATPYTSLSLWTGATSLDGNSFQVDPNFMSVTNLHINNATQSVLESRGVTNANIVFDIDNDVRPGPVGSVNGGGTAPDIGADEVDAIPVNVDIGVTMLVTPLSTGCHTNCEVVRVRLHNFASSSLDMSVNPVTINASTTGPNPQTFPALIISSGILSGNGNLDTAVTMCYDMTLAGVYVFNASASTPLDVITSNNAMGATSISLSGGSFTALNNGHLCLGDSTRFTLTGYTNGGTIQWQSSTDNVSWTNMPGVTTSNPYITPPDTMFYRALVCGLHASNSDTLFPIYVSPATTVNDTICGTGQATLTASGTATLNWYDAPSGGNMVNTGTTYQPTLAATDTFYVENASGTSNGMLTTTYVSNNGSSGNAFSVKALNTITVTSFDGHTNAVGSSTWEVWYRPNDYLLTPGSQLSNAGWTQVGVATNVPAAGPGVPTAIPIPVNITIPAGQTYSFEVFVTAGTGVNYTNGTAVGNLYTQNTDLQVFEGYGGTGFAGMVNSPRVWNGRIHYSSGCSSTRTPVIAVVTPAPAVTISSSGNICGSGSATLTANSSNTNYGYTWSPGASLNTTTGSTVIATPTVNTVYLVTANDVATGCTDTESVMVSYSVPPSFTLSANNDSLCGSDTTTLHAVLPNPLHQISNANVLNTSTTYPAPYGNWYGSARHQMLILASELTAAGMTAGYIDGLQFQVTNTNASAPLQNFEIDMAMTNITSITTFQTIPFTTVYTNALYTPTGPGVNTHTFQMPFFWDGTSNIIVQTCFVNATGPTTTSFTTNCTMRQTTTAFTSTVVRYVDNDVANCSNNTVTQTFSQRPNIAFVNSTGSWTYLWSPSGTLSSATVQNPVAQPTATTDYVLTVTDTVSGCSTMDTIRIVVNPRPMPNLGADTTICSNTSLDLDGSAGSYNYAWSTGATSQIINVNTTGTYSVLVTDPATGCANSDTMSLTVNAAPVFSLGNDTTMCSNNNITFSGPAGSFDYLWNTSDMTQSITTNTTGNYSLLVTDQGNGCASSDTVILTVNPAPPMPFGSDTSVCVASSYVLVAAPGYNYLWSDASTNDSLSVTASGIYSVMITDPVNGCMTGDTINLTVNQAPIVALGNDTTFCSASGPITLNGPVGSYTYLWSDASTGSSLTTNTTGNYYVTVTDPANGCVVSDTIMVNVPASPQFAINDSTLCDTVYTLSGPSGAYLYLWNTGATAQSIVTTAPGGTYTLTVTDPTSGCATTDAATIVLNTPPAATFSFGQSTICINDAPLNLTGSPAGGVFSGPGITGSTFDPSSLTPGSQSVVYTYTDGNGCVGTGSDVIIVSACVGIDEPFFAAGMNVYPNPNNGQFMLTIGNADFASLSIDLITLDGRIVYSDKMSDVKGNVAVPLSLAGFANGVYLLHVTADGTSYTQKIVKEE